MTDLHLQISWLAVLAASVAHFLLGGVWFVALFDRHYAKAMGIEDRPPTRPNTLLLVGPFVCGAMNIATTSLLLNALGITEYGQALLLGLIIGVGYQSAMTMCIAINPLFPRPFYYTLINAPMFIISSLMSCAILTALR